MGGAISSAAHGAGSVLGTAVMAPFKSVFHGSCKGICSGTWDVACFIEHICISDLIKLVMVLGLCYINLLFLYVLFKVGIIQCVVMGLFKMCWAACETYWCALADIISFLWYKITNIKRVNRRRRRFNSHFEDVESGYSSTGDSNVLGDSATLGSGKQKLVRSESRDLYGSIGRQVRHRHQHRHRGSRSGPLSIHVRGGSRGFKSSRRLRVQGMHHSHRRAVKVKRRKLR